jgi:ABC-type branched-subunit amino acid transport system substrate-binding protein
MVKFKMKNKLLVYILIPVMVMSFFFVQSVHAQAEPKVAPAFEPNVAPASLTIGGLFPMTGGLSASGIAREGAARIAIEEINNDTTTLLPDTTLNYVLRDTTTDPTTGATVAGELAALDVDVLIGSASSDVCKAIAAVSEANEIPQISYSCTNADLSNKLTYPWFVRTAPPDSIQGKALASLLYEDLEILEVATLATADSYGAGLITVFEAAYLALGGNLLASQQFPQGASDVSTQLQVIKDSGANVILFNGIVGDTKTVMAQAPAAGITPAAGYQWVGTDGSTQDSVFVATDLTVDTALQAEMQGMFGTAPNRGSGAIFDAFTDSWENCGGQDNTVYPGCGTRVLNTFATFSYDAVYMFAHAAQAMIDADVAGQGVDNGTALLAQLYKSNYVGATGVVTIDENGDRIGVYNILNHNGTYFNVIGSWDIANGAQFTSNIQYATGYVPAVPFVSVTTAVSTGTVTVTSVSVSTESPGFEVWMALVTLFTGVLLFRRRKK